jgi:hypothetical protein
MRKDWEYIIGILLVRWGACEYFWNILDQHYGDEKRFMFLSAWTAAGVLFAGFLLPLLSQRIYFKIEKKQRKRDEK